MMRFVYAVAVVGSFGFVGLQGCSSGSSSGGTTTTTDAAAAEETTGTTVQAATAPATVGIEAALAAIDSSFPALGAPPTVTVTGTSTDGTVTVDFGTATVVNNATVGGSVAVSYVRSGNGATLGLTFSGLEVTTSANGSVTVSGDLTSSVTLGGSGTASGTLKGTMTVSTSSSNGQTDSVTSTLDLTWSASAGTLVVSGRITSNGTRNGSWTLDLASLTLAVAAPPRSITAGTITLMRQLGVPVTVTIAFTGTNTGTITTNPPGTTTTFSL